MADGQQESPHVLINNSMRNVLLDVIRCLETYTGYDFAIYKIEWLSSFILRLGGEYEACMFPKLIQARELLLSVDKDTPASKQVDITLTGNKGRPKFLIGPEKLEYFLEKGFTATEISRLLGVSSKTIYRRLTELGMSVRSTYSNMSDMELDLCISNILHDCFSRIL